VEIGNVCPARSVPIGPLTGRIPHEDSGLPGLMWADGEWTMSLVICAHCGASYLLKAEKQEVPE
jgi:hypothetical protein